MYQVSTAFLEQMKSPIQEHKITGTIGSVSFDEANIVEGSFSISNQSTDTNDVVLGSCYVGQLTAEFVGINIAYGKWINKTITLSFGLKVGEYYEYVPLGVYKVKEAKHTDHGVQVTAYDNMIKFDKKFKKSHFMNLSGMTNIIDQLCTDAGVVCGMSHAQIEALPNGDRTGINIYGSKGKKAEFANDITTLRDLLFWVAQTLGCFATMNRAGQLEFRLYTQNVVDQITEQHRIAGATFADYVTHYIGIYVENLDDNTEDYYGYDATALQQELTETMAEITEDQEDITDLETDRAEWVQKLANHECTQEEYDAAIAEIDEQEKLLTKDINQLTKRVEWLSNAISMSADDGSDMVLGANPLTMAKNLTTRDQQRREILGALSNISYTPFNASVVCGCIYDLGDVIQFSGGLYNSDTDSFGCVMQYTYTHNGGTELEGFGVDPSVVVVRNKTQKSTDRASRNGIDATHNQIGTQVDPSDTAGGGENSIPGKSGDMYVKYQGAGEAEITIGSGMTEESESGDADSGYNVTAVCVNDSAMEGIYFHFTGLVVGEEYTFSLDNQITSDSALENWREHCLAIVCTDYYRVNGDSGWWPYKNGLQPGTAYDITGGFFIPMYYDKANHSYSHTFTATGTDFYVVVSYTYLCNVQMYIYDLRGHIKNCKLSGERFGDGKANITHANVNGEWRQVSYVNEASQTQTATGGTEIAEVTNNDGTKTKIYQKTVDANPQGSGTELLSRLTIGETTYTVGSVDIEANPSGTATSDLTKLGIDGTVYGIKDADAVHSADVGAAGGVAELDSNGRVPSSQLPSYVDDVVEYASRSAFPVTGESGKIYVALDTNLAYRWGGTEYVEISPSLALGETSSTAYRGDRGKAAYDHAQLFPIVDGKVCIVFEE